MHLPEPFHFLLPDFSSHCSYPLRLNKHCVAAAAASEDWLIRLAQLRSPRNGRKLKKFMGLKAGYLTALCYPDCPRTELRVVSDYMNFLFTLDDWSDEFAEAGVRGLEQCVMGMLYDPTVKTDKAAGRLARSFWLRMIRTAGPRVQHRFIVAFEDFFRAVEQQSRDRAKGVMPDLESYIALRRDTSGCRPVFVLAEYAAGIELPDEVFEHPIIQSMTEATNDLVTWSNDVFSYNKEQALGDTHNMITLLMAQHGLSLQGAVDFVGQLCAASITRFESGRTTLPSWGPDVDCDVQKYVMGLQDWIAGSLHWSFETERYFGKRGKEVRQAGVVKLSPMKAPKKV
ncbi:terpenoid synthase [Coniophora puteana RWD-64-598 SS2]|uniref:Terpene synthase n=1 Tax=Coniophora puteana (strain RWD-64-598) TaxID=741705 RepID=A0A5M3MX24_CONPW|nr:terpenoid synthase [Coniophora puteana RWD-64-598 SS2]EIW83693.1 terpenoid synthase [Coniophora puteana RWD-64-598 SS2]